jgi:hypothetical protein
MAKKWISHFLSNLQFIYLAISILLLNLDQLVPVRRALLHFSSSEIQKSTRSPSHPIPSPVSVRWQLEASGAGGLVAQTPAPTFSSTPLSGLPPSLRGQQQLWWRADPSCSSPFWFWPWRLARYFGRRLGHVRRRQVSLKGQPTILHLSPLPSSFLDWITSIQKISAEVVNPDPYFSSDGPNPLSISCMVLKALRRQGVQGGALTPRRRLGGRLRRLGAQGGHFFQGGGPAPGH